MGSTEKVARIIEPLPRSTGNLATALVRVMARKAAEIAAIQEDARRDLAATREVLHVTVAALRTVTLRCEELTETLRRERDEARRLREYLMTRESQAA